MHCFYALVVYQIVHVHTLPCRYLRQTRDVIQDQPYHKHVSCDLLRVTLQVAEGMVGEEEKGGLMIDGWGICVIMFCVAFCYIDAPFPPPPPRSAF